MCVIEIKCVKQAEQARSYERETKNKWKIKRKRERQWETEGEVGLQHNVPT